jgi:DNA excision repair protein ERCC-3
VCAEFTVCCQYSFLLTHSHPFPLLLCRRQEAQRLGRILRKKRALPGAASAEEYDAFFYTLVSNDTQEVYFTAKRQQFLVDQGYAYKVIPSLLDVAGAEAGGLLLGSRDEQLNVLAAILAASEAEAANEELPVGDDVEGKKYV